MRKKGEVYLFMTVTHYFIGELVEETPSEFLINRATWVPNTGYLCDALETGRVNESQPVGDSVCVPRPCITFPWRHAVPSRHIP
jgi:hypothetical protein